MVNPLKMKKIFVLLASACLLLLTSCKEDRNFYYTPSIDLNVQGGTSGQSNAAIQVSGSNYTPYSGGAYWGEDGKASNSHYTPYSERRSNADYNYYRGSESND